MAATYSAYLYQHALAAEASKKREQDAAGRRGNSTLAATMACEAAFQAAQARAYVTFVTAEATTRMMYRNSAAQAAAVCAKLFREVHNFRKMYCSDPTIASAEMAAATAADELACAITAAADKELGFSERQALSNSSERALVIAYHAAAAAARVAENPASALTALNAKLGTANDQGALAAAARAAAAEPLPPPPPPPPQQEKPMQQEVWEKHQMKKMMEESMAAMKRAVAEKELADLFAAQPTPVAAGPTLAEKELADLFAMQVDPQTPVAALAAGSSNNQKRRGIPKKIRDKVWNNAFGPVIKGNCVCCKEEIDLRRWDCAHIKAHKEGGTDAEENLRPTCAGCNRSMGVENLLDFKKRCYPDK